MKCYVDLKYIQFLFFFFFENIRCDFCLTQVCDSSFTIRTCNTSEKDAVSDLLPFIKFGSSTKTKSHLPLYENIQNTIYLPISFAVCYAKNFGPKGIGFGGLTQVEKKECE